MPTTIKEGATGESVSQAQFLLCVEGYEIGPPQIDGSFGAHTRSVVETFQQANSLSVDGVVGPDTWQALLQLAPVQQDPFPPTLEDGSTGKLVADLQRTLDEAKTLFAPTSPLLNVDGEFGPLTKGVVEALQHWAEIGVDGIVGYQTWAVSLDIYGQNLWAVVGNSP
jgi:peptidoglycan hydrolase-like protein with peptidoglycan-binding domain